MTTLLLACTTSIDLANQGAGGSSGSSGQAGAGQAGDGQGGAGQAGGSGACRADQVTCEGSGERFLCCEADQFCLYSEGCSQAWVGCGTRPTGDCPQTGPVACGCDGKTYANECEARRAGVTASSQWCQPVEECAATTGDLFASCPGGEPGEACAVLTDLVVRCTGTDFARGGVRVAPSPTSLYLGAGSQGAVRLLAATSAAVATVPAPALKLVRSPFGLLVDTDGRPRLASDESTVVDDPLAGLGFSGALVHQAMNADQTWTRVEVGKKPDNDLPLIDVAVSSAGVSHLWYDTLGASPTQATIDPATGQVTTTEMTPAKSLIARRYALGSNDQSVEFGLGSTGDNTKTQLRVASDLGLSPLGAPFAPRSSGPFFDLVAPPVAPL
ncbi:MAG: hypothetical protein EOO75_14220, partial [Myxococcales bacterium]